MSKTLKRKAYKFLSLLAIIILLIGMTFYHFQENWNWLDSLYFSVITLTTIGYGDLSPITSLGKVFTMLYVIIGIGIIFGFIRTISRKNLD